jgi:hypothetical protein
MVLSNSGFILIPQAHVQSEPVIHPDIVLKVFGIVSREVEQLNRRGYGSARGVSHQKIREVRAGGIGRRWILPRKDAVETEVARTIGQAKKIRVNQPVIEAHADAVAADVF